MPESRCPPSSFAHRSNDALGSLKSKGQDTERAMAVEGVAECLFSVDVEDWFHILDLPSTPSLSEWEKLPSRVEKNFDRLLDLFSEKRVSTTCFFLGWIGERFPHLVREAAVRGHEIASHGYSHRLVYELSKEEFHQDAVRSRGILEDLAGVAVTGYRSAGFSVTERTPWFFDILAEAGYEYDSSVFPSPRGHGGMRTDQRSPHVIDSSPEIIEFPITVTDLFGMPMCFFGGGYLRLFPYWLIRRMSKTVLDEGRPVVFYIHPREIDPDHPRLQMGLGRRFKSYVNLESTEGKLKRLLDEFPMTTFRDFVFRNRGVLLSNKLKRSDVAAKARAAAAK
jgi:polysaccharide deacetylase family protein (PEP-CTERM system associated)